MAATNGTLLLRNIKTGQTLTIDLEVPDATATNIHFNPSGLAASTSPASYTVPWDCLIEDVSVAAAPTAVGCIWQSGYTNINGATLRWSQQLSSLPNRPKLRIPLAGGTILSAVQF